MALPAAVLVGCTPKPSLFAAAAVTLKAVLSAAVNAPSIACKVKPVPVLVGIMLENVATPLDAATISVELPLSTPGLLIEMVTFELSVVTTLPNWS